MRRGAALAAGLAGALLAWAAAGPAAASGATPGGADDDPVAAFAALEARLAAAPRVGFAFAVESSGAFESRLEGRLCAGPESAELAAEGRFGGEPAALSLRQADGRLAGGNGPRRFDEPAPPATREALLVGWTRMGILHNLARLSAGLAPDGAGGGAADWVTVHDLRWGEPKVRDGRSLRPLSFLIRVSGQDSGEATLWVDVDGLPVAREQVVRFPGGEMRVVETYRDVRAGDAP